MKDMMHAVAIRKMMTILLLLVSVFIFAEDVPEDEWEEDSWAEEENNKLWDFGGFFEAGFGDFTKENIRVKRTRSLKEARARIEASRYFYGLFLSLKGDIYTDDISDETSAGFREAYLSFSLLESVDVRLGRQVLTWGTGDLVFLNDLFPKDWQSFFSGRDQTYLKSPSDALRIAFYHDAINIDLVWGPEFDSDNYLTGERFSYFNPQAGEIVAAPPRIHSERPARTLNNGEVALRLYKTINSSEIAFYGYQGFFKQPKGFDPGSNKPFFPRLHIFGASLRKPLGSGIGNIEFANHSSRQDIAGTDPLIPNSQNRFLVGYEQAVIPRLTMSLQYYLEWIRHFNKQKDNSLTPQFETGERRHVVSTRFTYRFQQDKLILSLFIFASPDEKDSYFIPKINWRYSDAVSAEIGANIFNGKKQATFLGQLEENSNIYSRARYIF